MADEPAKTTKKRIVKNPETFRERAIKAAASNDKPSRAQRSKSAVRNELSPILQFFGKGFRKFFGLKVFKPLRKPVRIIGKILWPPYLRNSWRELKLVTWPSWKESRKLTYAVLIFAIVFGAVIALVDYGLDKVFKSLLLK